jgi:hypothetical protein
VQFSEDFSSEASLSRFTWQMTHGGVDPFPRSDQPRNWHGSHDMACNAPPSLRDVNLHGATQPGSVDVVGNSVWWCAPGGEATRGHVMTSMSLVAYGHLDFSPSQTFSDVERICWDMNRSELGGRKWAQVSVIPEAQFQANGGNLDYVDPGLQGDVAAAGEHLGPGAFQFFTFRSATRFSNGGPDPSANTDDRSIQTLDAFGTAATDEATRYRHCLTETAGGVELTIARGTNPAAVRTKAGGDFHFPDGPVRVIFQDVTYDSIKGDLPFGEAQRTNTWHWDNVEVG